MIIRNVDKKIEFLQNEIISKNEIIQNLFRYNTRKDNNVNKNAGNIKDSSDTCLCRTCSSKDWSICIDASSPCNNTPIHRSTETQLKSVRKEKHKEYFHKVTITALSPRNNVMLSDKSNNHNVSKSGNVNKRETSFSKTDNNYWPPGTVALVGDLTVNGFDKNRVWTMVMLRFLIFLLPELEK